MNEKEDLESLAPSSAERFAQEADDNRKPQYILRLYIAGMTPRSRSAIENIRQICDEYCRGGYDLEVIDIYQQPERAREAQVIAAPTLIKKLPLPLRKMIGDMSDQERVLVGLDIRLME
ncbi:MAG: circadian clock KaiB family protein [Methanomicrobiaceae archaeon]|nr:circadian clock KaiB family protein [Methanomicrobiaceae archaeon]